MIETIKSVSTPSDVFLTNNTEVSWLIPAFSGRLVFVGHKHQTIDYNRKRQQADEFFSAQSTMDKYAFLLSQGIDYILVEEDIGWFSGAEYLQLVTANDVVKLYRVVSK